MLELTKRKDMVKVICPSRGRPKECGRMIDSFLGTAEISSLFICLDNDDPCLDEYRAIIGNKASYTIEQRKTTTEIINEKWRFSSDCFRWFSVTNDDFVYKTVGWDTALVDSIERHSKSGIGIAYGNDLLAGAHIPTTSIVSREIVEALGWLQMPRLTHLFGDNVWQKIGYKCDCLFYCPDVIIEHHHVFARKMEADQTHKETNSQDMYKKDESAFIHWLVNESKSDILKVKEVLCK